MGVRRLPQEKDPPNLASSGALPRAPSKPRRFPESGQRPMLGQAMR